MNETNYTNTEEILLQLGLYLDTQSRRTFLHGSVVNTDDVRDFLNKALDQLGHDFKLANNIIKERDTLILNGQLKVDQMISEMEEKIQNTDIAIAANEWSEKRVAQADYEYDQKMEILEIQTEEVMHRTLESRKKVTLDTHFHADDIYVQSAEELEKLSNTLEEIQSKALDEFTKTTQAIHQIQQNIFSLQDANRANLEEKMQTMEEESNSREYEISN